MNPLKSVATFIFLIKLGFFRTASANVPSDNTKQEPNLAKPVYRLSPVESKATTSWYILENTQTKKIWHLESPNQFFSLTVKGATIQIVLGNGKKPVTCRISDIEKISSDPEAKNPFQAVCDGFLYLRLNRSSDTRLSMTELLTDAMRELPFGIDQIGESIINGIKPFIVNLRQESIDHGNKADKELVLPEKTDEEIGARPLAARIKPTLPAINIDSETKLGIKLVKSQSVTPGRWLPASMHEGIYISLITADSIHPEIDILAGDNISKLGEQEGKNLSYHVAYDLSAYNFAYTLGTEHPKKQSDNIKGIARIGSVPPYRLKDSVGVFIGGFKSRHGTFKWGPNKGKTNGYVQSGLEFQPLATNLATFLTLEDGTVDILSWPDDQSKQDDLKKQLVDARQNGVLIIENGQPGPYVKKWGWGNWSGDANGRLKTMRSSVCIQKRNNQKFLIFSMFTGATPSAMAKTLMSFGCGTAMQLDMNAYMYVHNKLFKLSDDNRLEVQYLHTEMEYPKGLKRHRYILDNNNRDFFYVYKKPSVQPVEANRSSSSNPEIMIPYSDHKNR